MCSLLLLTSAMALAQGWDITPRLRIAETFTDNVNLAPRGEEEIDFVSQVNPGVSARRETARLDLSLDYNMQNLYFARRGEFETNHQLLGRSTAELMRNRFFLDADASIRQVLISAEDRVPLDNISRVPRTDVYTYGISPFWVEDFDGYMQARARYRLQFVHFGEGVADSRTDTVTASLDSGRRFTFLSWGVNYFYQQLERRGAEDSTRERADANVGYQLTDAWTLLARGGYESHDLATRTTTEDGTYWSLGARWTPNRFFSALALYGPRDREVTVNVNPTVRTSMVVTWRERDVGVDPGEQWFGSLSHRTRRTTWTASYTQEVTSVQQLQFIDEPFLIFEDAEGNQFFFDETGRLLTPTDLFTLTDVEFLRRRFQATASYRLARSVFTARSFVEFRDFETEFRDERSYGARGSWTWHFAPRTRSILSGEWTRIEFQEDREDNLWVLQAALARTFTPRTDGFLEYRYAQRDSTEPDRDFRENRISLFVTMVF